MCICIYVYIDSIGRSLSGSSDSSDCVNALHPNALLSMFCDFALDFQRNFRLGPVGHHLIRRKSVVS